MERILNKVKDFLNKKIKDMTQEFLTKIESDRMLKNDIVIYLMKKLKLVYLMIF